MRALKYSHLPQHLATGSPNKVKEFNAIIAEILSSQPGVDRFEINAQAILGLPEIQSTSVGDVARQKAIDAFKILGEPVLVEDSGLYLLAFPNRFPGALYKFFDKDEEGNPGPGVEGLLRMMNGIQNRRAVASTILAYCDGGKVHTFEGNLEGQITQMPRGNNGFGFDPIFEMDGKTLAEMTAEEKNRVSMRRRAIEKMLLG